MRKLLAAFGIILALAVPALAQETIINEFTIEHPTYTEYGSGIAYFDGTWKRSDPTIVNGVGEWTMDEGPQTWRIDKAEKTLYVTKGAETVGIAPVGIYYLDRTNYDFTQISALGSPSPVLTENSIIFEDAFLNVDMEVYSEAGGVLFDYVVKGRAGYPATPYDPNNTWVAFVHQLDLTDAPNFITEHGPVDWNGTETDRGIAFGSIDWGITQSIAKDSSNGDDDRRVIRNFLVQKGANYYFVEAVKYNWFLTATYPVRMHYTTATGNLSGEVNWTETVVITGNIILNAGCTLTVSAGAVVKFMDGFKITNNAAGAEFLINGAAGNHAIFTSCRDQTAGEDTSGHHATCFDAPTVGVWEQLLSGGYFEAYYAEVRWAGSGAANEEVIECFSSQSDFACVFKNGIVRDYGTGSADPDAFYYSNASFTGRIGWIENNQFIGPSWIDPTWMVYFRELNTGTVTFKNNIVIAPGEAVDILFQPHNDADPVSFEVTNNTFICLTNNSIRPTGLTIASGANNFQFQGNIIDGCAYNMTIANPNTRGFNSASNHGTANWGSYVTDGTDITSDPAFETYDVDGIESEADAYHLGAAASQIDGGHAAVAATGLTGMHTVAATTEDTGSVDMGFHFPGYDLVGGGEGEGEGEAEGEAGFGTDPLDLWWRNR